MAMAKNFYIQPDVPDRGFFFQEPPLPDLSIFDALLDLLVIPSCVCTPYEWWPAPAREIVTVFANGLLQIEGQSRL
jgi:hypothetical protein